MVRSRAAQPSLDLSDPPLEIVDQLNTRLDVTAPRLGETLSESSLRPATPNRSAIGT
jgi:hypothetical protein